MNYELFITAAIVIFTAIVTAFSTIIINNLSQSKQEAIQRSDLVQYNIQIIENVIKLIERLIEDVKKLNFFSLTTIKYLLNSINKLNNNINNLYLIKNIELRKDVINLVEQALNIIATIYDLEMYPYDQKESLNGVTSLTMKEFRGMAVELYKQGIYFDQNYKPHIFDDENIDNKSKKLEYIENMISNYGLTTEWVEQQNSHASTLKETERKRLHFTQDLHELKTQFEKLNGSSTYLV